MQGGAKIIEMAPKVIAVVKKDLGGGESIVLFFISMANSMNGINGITDSAIICNVSSCPFYLWGPTYETPSHKT